MNHPRKVSAVKKHFTKPYQSLEELRAGLKADDSEYTEEEIGEIIEAIGEQAKAYSQPSKEGQEGKASPAKELPSAEEMAEFHAWKASKNGLNAASTDDLVKAVTAVSPKVSRYKDFDVFQGKVYKEKISNPFNPERPNVVITHIQVGERKRLARIEPALAHEFNEFGVGQEVGMNHGDVSTAEFYFPMGKYTTGQKIPFAEFADFQRQDIRYANTYHPNKNISLLVASGYGTQIV